MTADAPSHSPAELSDHGLDVDHGRAVDRVQPFDVQPRTFDTQHAADSHAEPVGAVLSPLRQDAGQRPIFAASWVAGTSFDLLIGNPVEQEDDFGVAERIQPHQRVHSNLRRI